jgi:hypothetical protein
VAVDAIGIGALIGVLRRRLLGALEAPPTEE